MLTQTMTVAATTPRGRPVGSLWTAMLLPVMEVGSAEESETDTEVVEAAAAPEVWGSCLRRGSQEYYLRLVDMPSCPSCPGCPCVVADLSPPGQAALRFVRCELAERERVFGTSHGVDHAVEVCAMALHIWRREEREGDETLVELAALLHDVCDKKYVEVDSPRGRDLAAAMAAFLRAQVGEDRARDVLDVIDEVSFSRERRAIEAQDPPPWTRLRPQVQQLRHVISDADKLESIGDGGVRRLAEAMREDDRDMAPEPLLARMLFKFNGRERGILPYFRTPTGRAMAKPRYAYSLNWARDAHHTLKVD